MLSLTHSPRTRARAARVAVTRISEFFKMLEGRPRIKVKQLFVKEFSYVSTEKGGLFYPMAEIGDKVKKNQKVGEIWNVWGASSRRSYHIRTE